MMGDPNHELNRKHLMSSDPIDVLQGFVNELRNKSNIVDGLKVYIDLKMYDKAKERIDGWTDYLDNLLEIIEEYIEHNK